MELSEVTIRRFHKKIQRTASCWLWTGSKDRSGYGIAYAGYKPDGRKERHYAHRIAFVLVHGSAPSDLDVMHSCDNPSCVNPAHLKLGPHVENMRDSSRKGRTKKTSPRIRKISAEGVREIRQTKDYIPSSFYAKQWGVCVSHINRIRRGEKRKVS